MSTIVIRSKNKHTKGLLELSDDARRRAREHLKSVGIRVEELQPLIWPEDAVSAYREHMYAPWKFTLKSDILRQRRERMEHHLWWKREYNVTHRRPLYVWVFWCPGVGGFAFRGWWTYLIGKNISYSPAFRNNDRKTISRLMELFPLIEPKLFGPPNLDEWMAEFVRRYQRGYWCGKPQGKSPIWAEVQGSNIRRLLNRVEWPEDEKAQRNRNRGDT